MSGLEAVVRRLAERDGIQAAVLASADGLPIESAGRTPVEADAVAALAATLAQHGARLGEGTGRGPLRTAVLEYESGTVVLARLGHADWLALLADPAADLGELLYDLRQHRPALAALL